MTYVTSPINPIPKSVILSDSKNDDLSGLVETDSAFFIFLNIINEGNSMRSTHKAFLSLLSDVHFNGGREPNVRFNPISLLNLIMVTIMI